MRLAPDPASALRVHDDVLADPVAYAARARGAAFRDVPIGSAVMLHGIAPCPYPEIPEWLAVRYPSLTITLTCFRRSPLGQIEPSFIHNDAEHGDWAGILYLSVGPPPGDGTVFFRLKTTGAVQRTATEPAAIVEEWATWRDDRAWEPWTRIEARCGRLVLFPGAYFHARAIRENHGTGTEARLTQLLFGLGTLPGMEG